jgi:ABC-type Fe3+-hydroxamate transport system substrate-binding protein
VALLSRFAFALALCLALLAPAAAQGLTDSQQQALVDRVESFNAAMKANDMKTVMGVLPPRMLERIASSAGVTTELLLDAMQEQMDEVMQSVTIVSFGMDVAAAEVVTLEDGFVYAMIPTETVVDLGTEGGKMRANSRTLGLLEDEVWYLVRVDDAQQVAIVREVYPPLVNVEFPAGTVEAVTE